MFLLSFEFLCSWKWNKSPNICPPLLKLPFQRQTKAEPRQSTNWHCMEIPFQAGPLLFLLDHNPHAAPTPTTSHYHFSSPCVIILGMLSLLSYIISLLRGLSLSLCPDSSTSPGLWTRIPIQKPRSSFSLPTPSYHYLIVFKFLPSLKKVATYGWN